MQGEIIKVEFPYYLEEKELARLEKYRSLNVQRYKKLAEDYEREKNEVLSIHFSKKVNYFEGCSYGDLMSEMLWQALNGHHTQIQQLN